MSTEIASPAPETAEVSAEVQALTEKNRAIDQEDPQTETHEEATDDPAKPPKTPEQKSIERLERKLGRVIRQREELRAQLTLPKQPIGDTNEPSETDSEELRLTRADLKKIVEQQARQLAPRYADEAQTERKLKEAAASVVAELGQEQFLELTNDLAGYLPKDKQLAILRATKPAAVIQYLTDTDNATELEAMAGMDPFDFGRALARLETKMVKPARAEPSKVPAPLEPIKGGGAVNTKRLADMSQEEFNERRRQMLAAKRR